MNVTVLEGEHNAPGVVLTFPGRTLRLEPSDAEAVGFQLLEAAERARREQTIVLVRCAAAHGEVA